MRTQSCLNYTNMLSLCIYYYSELTIIIITHVTVTIGDATEICPYKD